VIYINIVPNPTNYINIKNIIVYKLVMCMKINKKVFNLPHDVVKRVHMLYTFRLCLDSVYV